MSEERKTGKAAGYAKLGVAKKKKKEGAHQRSNG